MARVIRRASSIWRSVPEGCGTEAKPRVLLTDTIHPDGQAILAREVRVIVAPDTGATTLRALIRDVDGIIVRSKLPDDIFEHAGRLKGVVRHGVGLDVIPVEAATVRGIVVANTPGINTNAVAEYVFAALLSIRRSLPNIDTRLRAAGGTRRGSSAPGFRKSAAPRSALSGSAPSGGVSRRWRYMASA